MIEKAQTRIIAKKRFGQNFLVDPRKADSLVKALDLHNGDTVIEVGPGKGMLTERLIACSAIVYAVELDKELIAYLQERFADKGKLNLIELDIIKFDPAPIAGEGIKLIGNLPYNISGAMIEWLIKYNHLIKKSVITVQREVADRLRATPNSRDYGSLSVIAQAYFDIKRLFNIPAGCFSPRPKVESTALLISPSRKIDDSISRVDFIDFARACFGKKRKTLYNSLGYALNLDKETIAGMIISCGFKADIRAEQIDLPGMFKLYKLFKLGRND